MTTNTSTNTFPNTSVDTSINDDYEVSEFTKTQLNADSIALIAKSWINLLDVKANGTEDTLTLIIEFVTPLPDGRSRWAKASVIVDRADYMFHEEKVIPLLVQTVEEVRNTLDPKGQ